MATVQNDSANQTTTLFDNFYNLSLAVNAAEYELIYSYFLQVAGNPNIAANLATLVFRIGQAVNIEATTLLEMLKSAGSNLEMNKLLCFYLNSFKANFSLYGVSQVPTPNPAIQRNVVL